MRALRKNFLNILFCLQFIPQILTFTCEVDYDNPNWLHEWRLILKKNRNSQFELFRDRQVPSCKEIYLRCNGHPKSITVRCQLNKMFDTLLPLGRKCTREESIPSVKQIDNGDHCPYTLYRVGYNVETLEVTDMMHTDNFKVNFFGHHAPTYVYGKTNITIADPFDMPTHSHLSSTVFLETYQVCFDHKHMRALFAINMAYPRGGNRPEFLRFGTDEIFTAEFFHAYDHTNTVNRFNELLGDSQKYMRKNNLDDFIDRGHLAPSGDFALTNLKRSTFEMINVIPQFKTIDNGNWRRIENWSRDPVRTPTKICTGVLDCNLDDKLTKNINCVVKLEDDNGRWVPMFLAKNRKIPIPLWTYKIVKNSRFALVFLTLNNIHKVGKVNAPRNICLEFKCPLELDESVKLGRTFCCSYNEFIKNNVPYLKEVC